jgi:hypothetical protein
VQDYSDIPKIILAYFLFRKPTLFFYILTIDRFLWKFTGHPKLKNRSGEVSEFESPVWLLQLNQNCKSYSDFKTKYHSLQLCCAEKTSSG